MKVYELARDMGITVNQIKLAAGELGNTFKHHMLDVEPPMEDKLREYFQSLAGKSAEPEPKKKATEPWKDSGNPWRQDLLKVKGEHKGYKPRWATRDNIQKWSDRGYQIADRKDYGELSAVVPGEEAQISTHLQRRELILMETTLENVRMHDEHLDRMSNEALRNAVETADNQSKGIERQGGHSVSFETEFESKRK